MKSLYVHFPFCESKCHYCDFYSIGRERTASADPLIFEDALMREAKMQSHHLDSQIDTIFFGGGTPSMTDPESMRRALAPLNLENRVHAETEWTMEANPSSVDLERLKEYKALGVNRIFMGVQVLRFDLFTMLGWVYSCEVVFMVFDAIFEVGIQNVSVDLLCGVPNQSSADVELAMEELTKYPITHLSCYLLTLPKTHRMFKDLPNESDQLEHLLTIDQFMRGKGFEHYEISNFAKPGHQAQHNLAYWTGKSYLALGPSAHSFDAEKNQRWKNISNLHKYGKFLSEEKSVIEWSETLTPEQRDLEKWMLALRLAEGFPKSWLDNSLRQSRAENLLRAGLLEEIPEVVPMKMRLTPRGFALSDQVISALS